MVVIFASSSPPSVQPDSITVTETVQPEPMVLTTTVQPDIITVEETVQPDPISLLTTVQPEPITVKHTFPVTGYEDIKPDMDGRD